MELTIWQLAAVSVGLMVLGVICGKLFFRKHHQGHEGFLTRIFRDNKDFDSTLDRVCISLIILFMLISFHDDFADPAKAGIVINLFLMAFNAWQSLVLNKTIKDLQNGHNGHGANHGNPASSGKDN